MSANTKIILPWIFSINLDNFFRLLVHTKSNEWKSAYNWFVFDIFQTETCISLTARIIDSPLFFWLVSPTRSRANEQLFPMWTIQEQRQRSWMKGELRKAIEQENTLNWKKRWAEATKKKIDQAKCDCNYTEFFSTIFFGCFHLKSAVDVFFTHIVFVSIKISLGECFHLSFAMSRAQSAQWKIAWVFITRKMNGKSLKTAFEWHEKMRFLWNGHERKIHISLEKIESGSVEIIYFCIEYAMKKRQKRFIFLSVSVCIRVCFNRKENAIFFTSILFLVIVCCHASLRWKSKEQKHSQ